MMIRLRIYENMYFLNFPPEINKVICIDLEVKLLPDNSAAFQPVSSVFI